MNASLASLDPDRSPLAPTVPPLAPVSVGAIGAIAMVSAWVLVVGPMSHMRTAAAAAMAPTFSVGVACEPRSQ